MATLKIVTNLTIINASCLGILRQKCPIGPVKLIMLHIHSHCNKINKKPEFNNVGKINPL